MGEEFDYKTHFNGSLSEEGDFFCIIREEQVLLWLEWL